MRNEKRYYVYMLGNRRNGAICIGVTSDLIKRVYEHKNGIVNGFTKTYGIHRLVYFEETNEVESALTREKQMKKWKRNWKIELIELNNPTWKDLCLEIV